MCVITKTLDFWINLLRLSISLNRQIINFLHTFLRYCRFRILKYFSNDQSYQKNLKWFVASMDVYPHIKNKFHTSSPAIWLVKNIFGNMSETRILPDIVSGMTSQASQWFSFQNISRKSKWQNKIFQKKIRNVIFWRKYEQKRIFCKENLNIKI